MLTVYDLDVGIELEVDDSVGPKVSRRGVLPKVVQERVRHQQGVTPPPTPCMNKCVQQVSKEEKTRESKGKY